MVGAVYLDNTALIFNNAVLLFDWELDADHVRQLVYGDNGPKLQGTLSGWKVKAKAYWAPNTIQKEQAFVRLFIGKDKDLSCLAGQVELTTLQKTDGICETELILQGVSLISLEGYRSEERSP